MSICTDVYRPIILRPRRVRSPECSAFQDQNRWIQFVYSLNLTPDPGDNDPASGLGAWSVWDLPVTYTAQDVALNGNDLLFVAIADRIYLLEWEAYRDQWNWEAYGSIFRQLTFGPIPGSADEQDGGTFDLVSLKRFRRFAFNLATPPADDPVQSQYGISVEDDGSEATPAQGYRRTQQVGEVKVAQRGYSFLVTVEHDANEDFPLLNWTADWDDLGDRRAGNAIVTS
jgi:hypothetical protein